MFILLCRSLGWGLSMEMKGGLMNDILIVFANTIFRMAKLFIAKQALKIVCVLRPAFRHRRKGRWGVDRGSKMAG